jgi:hypothetical protein
VVQQDGSQVQVMHQQRVIQQASPHPQQQVQQGPPWRQAIVSTVTVVNTLIEELRVPLVITVNIFSMFVLWVAAERVVCHKLMFASRKKIFIVLILFGHCNWEGARDCAYGHYKGDQKNMKRIFWQIYTWKTEQEIEGKELWSSQKYCVGMRSGQKLHCSGLCPVKNFDVNGVEPLGFFSIMPFNYLMFVWWECSQQSTILASS